MRSQLKLWRGDGDSNPQTPWEAVRWDGSRDVADAVLDRREVHGGWRLVEFLRRYFCPSVLFVGDPPVTDGTVLAYWDAVRWAVRLGGDPLLDDISDIWLSAIQAKMCAARYRRSPGCPERQLSAQTRAKHSRQLRSMLKEAAWIGVVQPMRPPRRARRRGAALRPKPKPAYTVPELRRIVAQAERIPVRGFEGCRLRSLWRSIYGVGFYCGVRREALLGLTWEAVDVRKIVEEPTSGDDGGVPVNREEPWLHVPAELEKDSERMDTLIHPALWTELLHLRGQSALASDKLVPWPCEPDWLTQRVKDAVAACGVGSGRGRDLHGLRRANIQWWADSDYDAEKKALARAAGHSDPSTTFGYYADVGRMRAKYVRQMPAIW